MGESYDLNRKVNKLATLMDALSSTGIQVSQASNGTSNAVFMLGKKVTGTQVGEDISIDFPSSSPVNTQVTADVALPALPVQNYMFSLFNPSTQTDLTVKLFSTEVEVDTTVTRYALLGTIVSPLAATVSGTVVNMTETIVNYLFPGTDLRIVASNDTVLVAGAFSAIARIRELN